MATLKIPSPLRKFTENQSDIAANGATVGVAIADASNKFPALKAQLYNQDGTIRNFIRLYVGDEDINALDGEKTRIEDQTVISIIPAIAGGSL